MGHSYKIGSCRQENVSIGTCVGIGKGTRIGVDTCLGIVIGDQDEDYHLTVNGLVRFRDKIYVPNCSEIKKLILREV